MNTLSEALGLRPHIRVLRDCIGEESYSYCGLFDSGFKIIGAVRRISLEEAVRFYIHALRYAARFARLHR